MSNVFNETTFLKSDSTLETEVEYLNRINKPGESDVLKYLVIALVILAVFGLFLLIFILDNGW